MHLSFWDVLLTCLFILFYILVIPSVIQGYHKNKARGLAQGMYEALKIITKQEKEKK